MRAQNGEHDAVENLLQRFRPLLRARMHWLWSMLREDLHGAEWDDVEAQIQLLFLSRLESFRPDDGVFFPYYIARFLDFDARDWLRRQRRAHAVPFSQLISAHEESDDLDWWLGTQDEEIDLTPRIDDVMSLRTALGKLTPAQNEAITLCYARGLTEQEAAKTLGVSRSAVRNRLQSAIHTLREFFGQNDEADPEPACVGEHITRTGRHSEKLPLPMAEWIRWRTNMAKDEKRPDLIGIGAGKTVLLQGVYDFPATGLKTPQLLSPRLRYVVPRGQVVGIRFLRVGVSCNAMSCISTVVNGMPHRLIPMAANSSMHVPFAIVEPIVAGSEIEIHIASDQAGTAIIDVGCLEMPA